MGWMVRVRFPAVQDFSLIHSVHGYSGAHLASSSTDTGGSFPRGKAAEREADHCPPSSTEVMNIGAKPPLYRVSS
jgi:hypothetical protein